MLIRIVNDKKYLNLTKIFMMEKIKNSGWLIWPKMVVLMLLVAGCSGGNQKVTLATLLQEMTNREIMASFPQNNYVCRQFSSYNQTSVKPGDFTWFANLDNNYFLRTEENNGRREFVLFDSEGPGAVVRFWTTFNRYDKEGVFRFYFDDETEPRIEGEPMSLISGGELVGPPLSFSVSNDTDYSRRGHNLYLPVPFAKRLKITYETDGIYEARDGIDEGPDQTQEMFYYQINYRKYDEGAQVESFHVDQLKENADLIETTLKNLEKNDRGLDGLELQTENFSGALDPGKDLVVSAKGERAVRKLQIRLSAGDLPQALRSTVISVSFDGNQTIWAPVGDFFGTGYQVRPASTWYHETLANGTLQVYWIMPFKEEMTLKISNLGEQEVQVVEGELATSNWNWDSRSMYFGSSWRQNTKINTGLIKGRDGKGDFYDINYATLNGKGVLVGDAVTLFNCSPAWWGEGDEKIFVDNEEFPSHFGTGTEDYYGYAWCRPENFVHSFIAQPDGSGNLSVGYTQNIRYRTLDAIPFHEKLQFDMEMWHWGSTIMNHAPIAYWYMQPGGVFEVNPDTAGVKEQVVLRREQIFEPVVNGNGAIEGEDLVVEKVSGKAIARIRPVPVKDQPNWTRAAMGWNNISNGDEATFRFYCKAPGTYDVAITTMSGKGNATFMVLLNDKTILPDHRLANSAPGESAVNLRNVSLNEGSNNLTLKLLNGSGMANNLAIDQLQFTKK